MNPYQTIAALLEGLPGDPCEQQLFLVMVFRRLERNFYRCQMSDGRLVRVAAIPDWFRELESAARLQAGERNGVAGMDVTSVAVRRVQIQREEQMRYGNGNVIETCPRCGHIHAGRECGFPIGGGRTCRCEIEEALR